MTLLSVGDVARELDVRPSRVTQLFYERRLRDDLCPIVAGRRLIPPSYVPIIAMELRRKGVLVREAAVGGATDAAGDGRGNDPTDTVAKVDRREQGMGETQKRGQHG